MIDTVRGLVRPVVTLALVASAGYMVIQAISVPEWYQVMVSMSLAYWFAGRKTPT